MPIQQYGIPETSGFSRYEVFTSSGTWTVPAGVEYCAVYVAGGGAPGNSGSRGYIGSSNIQVWKLGGDAGGGGSISVDPNMKVTPGETISVTVGGQSTSSSFKNLTSGRGSGSSSISSFHPMSLRGLFGGTQNSGNFGIQINAPQMAEGTTPPGPYIVEGLGNIGASGVVGAGGVGGSRSRNAYSHNPGTTNNGRSGLYSGGAGGNSAIDADAEDGTPGGINTGAGGGGGGASGSYNFNDNSNYPYSAGAGGAGGSGFVVVWY